jgi:hypothetical protein
MSYFVTISCQINNPNPVMQQQISQKLQGLGFSNVVKGRIGLSTLPPNTYAGEFNGESAVKIRDDLNERATNALKEAGAKGSIFMLVSQNWTWAIRGL